MEMNIDDIKRDIKNRRKANEIYIAMAEIDIEKANSTITTLTRENRDINSQIRQIALMGGIE